MILTLGQRQYAVKASEITHGQCGEVCRQPVDRFCPVDRVLENFGLDANA